MSRQAKEKRPERTRHQTLTWRVVNELTSWLEGHTYWLGSKIGWRNNGSCVVPDGKALARAQRKLTMVRLEPRSAQRLTIDFDQWLNNRQKALDEAKILAAISESDLASLLQRARKQDSQAISKAVELLAAEAVCLNDLQESVSVELVKIGAAVEPHLLQMCERQSLPDSVRGLLAMTLGNLRSASPNKTLSPSMASNEHLRRCYYWGMKFGVCKQARVFVALLRQREGIEQAERFIRLFSRLDRLRLPAEFTYQLLLDGLDTEELIRSVDVLAMIEAQSESLLRYRDKLPDRHKRQEREPASRTLKTQRSQTYEGFRQLLFDALKHSQDSRALVHLSTFVLKIFSLCDPSSAALDVLARHLTTAGWSGKLYADYLKLLVELLPEWEAQPPSKKQRTRAEEHDWLAQTTRRIGVRQLAEFLKYIEDPQITLQAHRAELCGVLVQYRPDLIPTLLRISKQGHLKPYNVHSWADNLRLAMSRQMAPPEFIEKLTTPLTNLGQDRKQRYLDSYFSHFSPVAGRRSFDQAFELLKELVRLGETAKVPDFQLWYLAEKLSLLESRLPATWRQFSHWMCDCLCALPADGTEDLFRAFDCGIVLAVKVVGNDFAGFVALVREILKTHVTWRDATLLEDCSKVIDEYPKLKETLKVLLLTRPHQSINLLGEIGLITNSRSRTTRKIEEVLSAVPKCDIGERWNPIIQIAPMSKPFIERYVTACKILKREGHPPKSVLILLNVSQQMKDELTALEKLAGSGTLPESKRSRIETRMENLRSYIKDHNLLQAGARKSIMRKTEQLAAELEFEALRQIIDDGYRQQLKQIVGESSAEVAIDDDWANAIRICTAIQVNRRTLKSLLQAIAEKDDWIAEQPANKAFLSRLQKAGGNPDVWLSEYRQTYENEVVPGGQVTLYLESNPLKVLQMGNYAGTCLGFAHTAENVFATVPNAVELNKRVVYALNSRAELIGRKLIAISDENELVGFRTYSWSHTTQCNKEVIKIFATYCRQLAQAVNVNMDCHGYVSRLFCRAWHDDGLVDWDSNDYPLFTDDDEL